MDTAYLMLLDSVVCSLYGIIMYKDQAYPARNTSLHTGSTLNYFRV
jgi:hypothetical protein